MGYENCTSMLSFFFNNSCRGSRTGTDEIRVIGVRRVIATIRKLA